MASGWFWHVRFHRAAGLSAVRLNSSGKLRASNKIWNVLNAVHNRGRAGEWLERREPKWPNLLTRLTTHSNR